MGLDLNQRYYFVVEDIVLGFNEVELVDSFDYFNLRTDILYKIIVNNVLCYAFKHNNTIYVVDSDNKIVLKGVEDYALVDSKFIQFAQAIGFKEFKIMSNYIHLKEIPKMEITDELKQLIITQYEARNTE